MTESWPWIALALSVSIVGVYELRLARVARRDPARIARTAHSVLRGEWVRALSKQPGFEIVAVQALRNSLMSATITASTAALVLMGSMNLIVPKHDPAGYVVSRALSVRLVLELGLAVALFASFICSSTAMRYYHHAGFAMSMPIGSSERTRREPLAITYVQRGGTLYSWSLRCFWYSAPITVGLLNPLLMPLAAAGLAMILSALDGAPQRVDA